MEKMGISQICPWKMDEKCWKMVKNGGKMVENDGKCWNMMGYFMGYNDG